MQLIPPASQHARIANLDTENGTVHDSRVPVLVNLAWDALLSRTTVGRELRAPFWLPLKNYADITPNDSSDEEILSFLTQLYSKFRVYLKTSLNGIAFTPLGTEINHDAKPTIYFDTNHHEETETLRSKILEDEDPDDLDEMRQFDVATITAFLHELAHVLWRARWPGLIDTPPKYKALVGSKAKEGQGEGGELIKVAIYGGVMDLIPYDLRGMENARGLFYKAWDEAAEEGLSLVPEYDDEFRCLCSILKGGTQRYYLTRSGAAHMCDVILNAESRNRTYDTIRLVGAFIDLPGPADSTESPLRARSKKRPRILVDSSTVHSISSLTSSSSLAPLSYNPGIKSLPAKTFKLCDQAKGRVHQQATDNKN